MNIQNLMGLANGTSNSALLQTRASAEGSETSPATDTVTDTATGTSTAPTPPSETAEEFETFLTLLTAQIKNQDPLAPLDSTQFVEQLATFSALELQVETNQKLDQITYLLNQQLGEE